MKARYFIIPILAVLCASSCQKIAVNNHDDLRQPKVLDLPARTFNLGWEKDTIKVDLKANCIWGFEFLAWADKVSKNGADTTQVMSSAKWMNTPVLYGQGDALVDVIVEANAKSNKPRKGFIRVYTGDEDVYTTLTVVQAGNPSYVPPHLEPMDLTFSFTSNTMNWPTASQSVGEYTYPLNGVEYSFYLGRCNMGNYLVIHNAGAYLGLPAIENYKLTKVTAVTSSNNSRVRGALVAADEAGTDVVGENQAWPASPLAKVEYDLEGTLYNTRYYLICTELGLPTDSVILHYEP